VVVCAAGDESMFAELERLNVPTPGRILNPHPELGMFSSIRCAAQRRAWGEDLTHWTICLGDQPHLRPETLQQLMESCAAQPDKIHQPRWKSRPRHPVVLPKSYFRQLATSDAASFKDFLTTVGTEVVAFDANDPGLDFDIDTPADYERARVTFLRAVRGELE
jgi:CTP:molybdopterin cytidylyltransferase MocA